jgi:hypothetical protein
MPLITRYRITDQIALEDMRALPVLSEIPYFLKHHRGRLRYIDDIVAVASNRSHTHPNFVRLNTFHTHQTPYAAIDALAPPLAEFFMQTEILPVLDPIFSRYKDRLEELSPALYRQFAERGILIPREARE